MTLEIYNKDEIALHYDGMGISGIVHSLVRFHVIKIKTAVFNEASAAEETAKCADVDGDKLQTMIIDRDRTAMGTLKDERSHKTKYDKSENQIIDDEVKTPTALDSTTKGQSRESEEETPTQVESAPLTMPMHFPATTYNSYE